MNKNEALKAMVDGKMVYHPKNTDLQFYWSNTEMRVMCNNLRGVLERYPAKAFTSFSEEGWMIIPEKVEFLTAIKAFKEGKTIRSIAGEDYAQRCSEYLRLSVEEIEGEWEILD